MNSKCTNNKLRVSKDFFSPHWHHQTYVQRYTNNKHVPGGTQVYKLKMNVLEIIKFAYEWDLFSIRVCNWTGVVFETGVVSETFCDDTKFYHSKFRYTNFLVFD